MYHLSSSVANVVPIFKWSCILYILFMNSTTSISHHCHYKTFQRTTITLLPPLSRNLEADFMSSFRSSITRLSTHLLPFSVKEKKNEKKDNHKGMGCTSWAESLSPSDTLAKVEDLEVLSPFFFANSARRCSCHFKTMCKFKKIWRSPHFCFDQFRKWLAWFVSCIRSLNKRDLSLTILSSMSNIKAPPSFPSYFFVEYDILWESRQSTVKLLTI
jgi:hypothetical protein